MVPPGLGGNQKPDKVKVYDKVPMTSHTAMDKKEKRAKAFHENEGYFLVVPEI